MGFFKRAVLSLEQRVEKHRDEFHELYDDIVKAVDSVRQQQAVLLEKETRLVALQAEHVGA